jgi:carboxymethylenebutenolidase
MLRSADGTRVPGYLAQATRGGASSAGIVIVPDAFGLRPFYQELAHRFAATGVQALAIDLYGRTAGPTPQPRDETFDFWPHIRAVQTATVAQDIAAGIAFLRTLPEDAPKVLFTLGFCFGGATSFLQAALRQGLAGVIGFYGPPIVTPSWQGPAPAVMEHVSAFTCPVLGIFGGADPHIPAESIAQFDTELAAANIAHELVIYPEAPHSFFDWGQSEYAQASNDAWRRVLAFIRNITEALASQEEMTSDQ